MLQTPKVPETINSSQALVRAVQNWPLLKELIQSPDLHDLFNDLLVAYEYGNEVNIARKIQTFAPYVVELALSEIVQGNSTIEDTLDIVVTLPPELATQVVNEIYDGLVERNIVPAYEPAEGPSNGKGPHIQLVNPNQPKTVVHLRPSGDPLLLFAEQIKSSLKLFPSIITDGKLNHIYEAEFKLDVINIRSSNPEDTEQYSLNIELTKQGQIKSIEESFIIKSESAWTEANELASNHRPRTELIVNNLLDLYVSPALVTILTIALKELSRVEAVEA